MPTPAENRRNAALRRSLIRARYGSGPLPSVHSLAKEFAIDRGSIRRDLRALGLVAPTPAAETLRKTPPGDTGPDAPLETPDPGERPPTPEGPDRPWNPADDDGPDAGGDVPPPPPPTPDAGEGVAPALPAAAPASTPPLAPPPPPPAGSLPKPAEVSLTPDEVTVYRRLLGALDHRLRQQLAPIIQQVTQTRAKLEESLPEVERGDYPIAAAPAKAESRITSKLIVEAGNESMRIIEWDLQAGEVIRRRWTGGWSTRFENPQALAQFAIDFLAEKEDRIAELEEQKLQLELRLEWLSGFLSPVRRLRTMEERLLAMVFAAQIQGKPMEPAHIRAVFALLQESARVPLVREEFAMTVDLGTPT